MAASEAVSLRAFTLGEYKAKCQEPLQTNFLSAGSAPCYKFIRMNSPPRASGSIIAAGISAVLAGIFGIFSALAILILFSTPQFTRSAPFPPAMRPILYGVWIFLLFCALFIVVTGLQVIRLRNWARLSLLVIAGCLLCFGLLGIVVIFVTIFVATPLDPRVSQALLVSILAVIYGIPIAISLWWLILFTRRSVIAQFEALAASMIGPISEFAGCKRIFPCPSR